MVESKRILEIAKIALEMLEKETDKQQFLVEYYAAVSALRSVGHVLDKVDKQHLQGEYSTIDEWWSGIKKNREKSPIFHEFIEKERNQLLKEGAVNMDEDGSGKYLLIDNMVFPMTELSEDMVFVPIENGMYKGEDVRDVIKSAIDWWEEQFHLLGI